MKYLLIILNLFVVNLAQVAHAGAKTDAKSDFARPKLLLMIAIDQFRADYLTRFESQFLPPVQKDGKIGGFRYLMSKGAYYQYGRYDIMQSITAPGHMTIATGSYPYQSGIVGNDWYDRELGRKVYCTQDEKAPLINGTLNGTLNGERSDPTEGRSPRSLIGSTVGDQLKVSSDTAKVVTVALKDRAAIMMGGHSADLAVWMNKSTRRWTTSLYYLPEGKLPNWVEKVNEKLAPELKPYEGKDIAEMAALPLGAKITADAAESALSSLNLGKGKGTDLFAVSFSSHDAAGHRYGANSKQMAEMTLADDQAISQVLNAAQKHIPGGLKNVVVVLTGDHGVAPNEEYSNSVKLPHENIPIAEVQKKIEELLTSKFGKLDKGPWIIEEIDFRFYLNRQQIAAQGIDAAKVELEVKSFLAHLPGVAHVFSQSDYEARRLPPGIFERQILHSYYPSRSGDVIILQKPFVTPVLASQQHATHMSGYAYDRTVPIVFAGMHIKPGRYATPAEVIDIAPTLTFLAGVIPPSSSEGRVLAEILDLR